MSVLNEVVDRIVAWLFRGCCNARGRHSPVAASCSQILVESTNNLISQSASSFRSVGHLKMRLLHTTDLTMEEFEGSDIPPYAILSHTWEKHQEVTFRDWQDLESVCDRTGFHKIMKACEKAREHGLDYLWVDTCCIDKSSSAELSEAINSMYDWYLSADICICYLSDVPPILDDEDDSMDQASWVQRLSTARWFTRGWTLQELLAPDEMYFYYQDWSTIGTKEELANELAIITGIDEAYLLKMRPILGASIARRMSWAARRSTTRREDIAYCLLGIFDINMPLVYGEGEKAFLRLQKKILRDTTDQTIFCWEWDEQFVPDSWVGLLAPSPAAFANSGNILVANFHLFTKGIPYSKTNSGIKIRLPILRTWRFGLGAMSAGLAMLNARREEDDLVYRLCIPLGYQTRKDRAYPARRVAYLPAPLSLPIIWFSPPRRLMIESWGVGAPLFHNEPPELPSGFLLTFAGERQTPSLQPLGESSIDETGIVIPQIDLLRPFGQVISATVSLDFGNQQRIVIYMAKRRSHPDNAIFYHCQVMPANRFETNKHTLNEEMVVDFFKPNADNQGTYYYSIELGAGISLEREYSFRPGLNIVPCHIQLQVPIQSRF